MKVCIRCKKAKPDDEYYFRNRKKGYLMSWCKKCCKNYSTIYVMKKGQLTQADKDFLIKYDLEEYWRK